MICEKEKKKFKHMTYCILLNIKENIKSGTKKSFNWENHILDKLVVLNLY